MNSNNLHSGVPKRTSDLQTERHSNESVVRFHSKGYITLTLVHAACTSVSVKQP